MIIYLLYHVISLSNINNISILIKFGISRYWMTSNLYYYNKIIILIWSSNSINVSSTVNVFNKLKIDKLKIVRKIDSIYNLDLH